MPPLSSIYRLEALYMPAWTSRGLLVDMRGGIAKQKFGGGEVGVYGAARANALLRVLACSSATVAGSGVAPRVRSAPSSCS